MSLDHNTLAKVLPEIKASVEADIVASETAPAGTLELFRVHWQKPWVPGILTSLISPMRSTARAYLKLSVLKVGFRVWYIPSAAFWRMHTMEAHGPDGSGCDVAAHVHKLTDREGKAHFMYADVMLDGRLRILGEDDFKIEAGYWLAHFQAAKSAGGGPVTEDE